jgi:hypothetical protein
VLQQGDETRFWDDEFGNLFTKCRPGERDANAER